MRWLSQGKVLERFVESFDKILLFIENKDLINVPQIKNHIWISNLMFFTDLSVNMNELNLQGLGKSFEVIFGYIKSFEVNFKFSSEILKLKHISIFLAYFDKATAPCEMKSILLYQNIIYPLIQQFSERFNQFRSLEQTIKIIKCPDVVDNNTLELKDFKLMQIDDLGMQLVDFQNSIWTQGFVELRSVNMGRNRLKNENEYNYEEEILMF